MGDYLLGEFRHAADGNLGEIQARLLIHVVLRVECGALVAGIRGDDGKSTRQSGVVPGGCGAHRRPDATVISAPALEQEPVIPVVG